MKHKVTLRDNGYFESIIDSEIFKKLARLQSLSKFGLSKYPKYLKLPWIGNTFLNLKTKLNSLLSIISAQLDYESFSQTGKSFHP